MISAETFIKHCKHIDFRASEIRFSAETSCEFGSKVSISIEMSCEFKKKSKDACSGAIGADVRPWSKMPGVSEAKSLIFRTRRGCLRDFAMFFQIRGDVPCENHKSALVGGRGVPPVGEVGGGYIVI